MTAHPPYEIITREDWVFELTVDGDCYRVIWLNNIRTFDGYEEHRLTVFKNGIEPKDSQDTNSIAATKAAQAYRIFQLQAEYRLNDELLFFDNRKEKMKRIILELAERAWGDEFLGQDLYGFLYAQTVSKILDERDIHRWLSELIAEEKIGLNGAILIPYEEYIANFSKKENSTGHRKIGFNDQGDWYCSFCKTHGSSQAEEDPWNYPCVKAA